MRPIDKVRERLSVGKDGMALCPAHDDKTPSLSIGEGDDGKVLLKCFAGCSTEDILGAIDLRKRDLFEQPKKNGLGKHVATREIKDVNGELQALQHRYRKPDDTKEDKWQSPDGTWSLKGKSAKSLPLYGSEQLAEWTEDVPVVLTEGAQAAQALMDSGIVALGTVTGASYIPDPEVFEVLRNHPVTLWPDADKAGYAHMHRVAARLQGIAREVRWFEWPEAPEGGDAGDHPEIPDGDVYGLEDALLEEAPLYEPPEEQEESDNPLLRARVKLAEGMIHGIEPPEELEPGVLLKGKVHWLYAPGGAGKTMLMLWMVKRCIERGENVVLLDAENGRRIVSERLELLGVDPEKVDEHLIYLSSPSLTLADAPYYEALLDEAEPALVVFDSLIAFLAGAGCEENSNTDVAAWAGAFCHPARAREIAVLLIDHVPHDGAHARGATRKRDEADVQWKLHKTQDFDRASVGEIVMFREKDREAWLPPSVKFSVGGAQDGFLFEQSEGTVAEEIGPDNTLDPKAGKALAMIRERGEKGARFTELHKEMGGSKSTLKKYLNKLIEKGLCWQDEKSDRYFAVHPEVYRSDDSNPEGDGDGGVLQNPVGEPNMGGTPPVHPRYGTPPEPGVPEAVHPGTPLWGGVPGVPAPYRPEEEPVPADEEPSSNVVSRAATEAVPDPNSGPRRLSEREVAEVRKLIAQGAEPQIARAEVLSQGG